jgi:hypothetical protein
VSEQERNPWYPGGERDAMKWTEEFCRLNPTADPDTMIGWFANAIETGVLHGRREAEAQTAPALDVEGWADVMLDALRESDGGNNPFYSDDDDTVSLARQLAEAVVARLRR